MLLITGYVDRLSARPGGTIAFKISSQLRADYVADLVRIRHGDPNPAGPGMKVEPVDIAFGGTFPSRSQAVQLGSWAVTEAPVPLDAAPTLTLGATIWPTLPGDGRQTVVALGDPDAGDGIALEIGPDGAALVVATAAGPRRLATGAPLSGRTWYRLRATVDFASGAVSVTQATVRRLPGVEPLHTAEAVLPGVARPADAPFTAAAAGTAAPARFFNGKIERPFLAAAAVDAADHAAIESGGMPAGVLVAWDFGRGIDTERVFDAGLAGRHGRVVNLPTRGMMGAHWSGREMCWRHAPEDYGAIHFHDDDLHDCGWETDFSFTVPEGMPSGIYGARLRCEGHEDVIPFYVRPAPGAENAILFVGSSFTFQAYANHARGNFDAAFRARVAEWGAYPHNADDHHDYAHSTYNTHRDGSGVALSSRLRPMLTMRPGYLTFNDPKGSGLRHFPADSHLVDWLEQRGFAFDVCCDEDVDEEGVDALRPYRVVLTGSHPEYHTPASLDAWTGYAGSGGRIMYMGGNGFYWRIARNPAIPGAMEIRRTEGGIRTWAAEPGEYWNQLDGGYGGLWRRSGRPPQRLVGVGFSSQGLFEAGWYRRAPGAADPRAAWMFDGVDGEVLGDFGLSAGGAAGFELDRADVALGTPPNAIVVAVSEQVGPSFFTVPEELLSKHRSINGEPPDALIRADMTYFETPDGGAVFSTGSITFCGSLSHNGYDNPVSRLVGNVLRRFAAA